MLSSLSRKITIALVALVVYCTLFAVVLTVLNQGENLGFTTLWLTFLVLSAPLFIVAGVAMSYILERIVMKPFGKLIVFTFVGAIIILPYSAFVFNFQWDSAWGFMLFGAIAGLIYFTIQYLFDQFFFKKHENKAT